MFMPLGRLPIGDKMTEQQVIDITREALFVILECALPLLLISLIVGLVVSIFQTITSIQ